MLDEWKNRRVRQYVKWMVTIGIIFLLSFVQSERIYAVDQETLTAVRQELLDMLLNADATRHDVYDYRMTSGEIDAVWTDLIENEGYLAAHTYKSSMLVFPSKKNGYSEKIYIYGIDEGFKERYPKVLACVEEVKNATKGMTDLEKVLYVHDYVVDCSVYDSTEKIGCRAGGPLGEGRGYCSGYADAMAVLLKYVNVPCATVSSSQMSHAWNYVKIDGKWYHLDATWDETPSELTSDMEHYYFLRNDTEYKSELRKSHYGWNVSGGDTITSASTTYADWFVHDILGRMFYYNGLWYYVDNKTGNIVSSEIDVAQSDYKVRVNRKTLGASKLAITKVEAGIIYYTADGVSHKQLIDSGIGMIEIDNSQLGSLQGSSGSSSDLSGLSWNSISDWRSGHYSMQTGKYVKYDSRICLNDYVKASAGQIYQVKLSNANCHMLIREMTSGKQFITSHNLSNGDIFETKSNTAYLAISLYMPDNAGATMTTYRNMFASGITVGLTKITRLSVGSNLKWGNVGYWRSGIYSLQTGKYVTYPTRICLNDYVSSEGNKTYKVLLSNSNCHMLIRELTSGKAFIKSHNLAGGSSFTTTANTGYLAISLYMPAKDSTACFSDYKSAINGIPGLQIVQ